MKSLRKPILGPGGRAPAGRSRGEAEAPTSRIPHLASRNAPRTTHEAPRTTHHALSTRHRTSAFTLIELLAAVTILMVIVWIMAVIFTESDRAWNLGTSRAEVNIEGRAALSMIAHDLQYALAYRAHDADGQLYSVTFAIGPDRDGIESYGFSNDQASFISLQDDAQGASPYAMRAIWYYLTEDSQAPGKYVLRRNYESENLGDLHIYDDPDWHTPGRSGKSETLAENVTALAFFLPDGTRTYQSPLNGDKLPEYVDIFLEILPPKAADEVLRMKDSGIQGWEAYLERNARRFTTRVYFRNAHGYEERGPIWGGKS